MIESNRAHPIDRWGRTTVHAFSHATSAFPLRRAAGILGRGDTFSLTQRVSRLGPLTLIDLTFGADTWIRCATHRPHYQLNMPINGHIELAHRNASITAEAGRGAMCVPEGDLAVSRWGRGGRTLALRIERNALEETLSGAIGHQVHAQIEFAPSIITSAGPARSLMQMMLMLNHELARPDTALTRRLIAGHLAESVMRTVLLATDHPYRDALTADARYLAPKVIRTAVEIIEAQAHQPLTLSFLAVQSHISTRTLQDGFRRHMGMSPMAYLRQVRLRYAHQQLLESDASVDTVTSIAQRWGFTNYGRFASAHAARYGESPANTLRRSQRAPKAAVPRGAE